jgi:tetratricopeptide (TPR) repeat protein
MSFGALSALAFAMRNPAVDAVNSLEGGIGSTPNVQNFGFTRGAFHDVARFTKPLLHLHAPLAAPTELDYLRTLEYSERRFIEFPDLKHEDFGGMARALAERDSAALEAFESMESVAAAFLDEALGDRRDLAAPSLKARPAPPSATELLHILSSGGIEALRQHHRSLSSRDPHPIPVATYRLMIFTTLENSRDPELAREIARMFVADYPESARAAFTLGNLEARMKDNTAAVALFSRALDLAPRDALLELNERDTLAAGARQRLDALAVKSP